jgi:CBS domain-containing protein
VSDVELEAPAGAAAGPPIPEDALLRDALSTLLAHEARSGPVVDPDGRVVGVLTIDTIAHAASPEDE